MFNRSWIPGAFVASFVGLAIVVGCTQSPTEESSTGGAAGGEYFLDQAPAGAQDVIAARETVQDGAEVVLTGRIGGSVDPWIANRAAFTVVDNSLQACSDIPGDQCETPWDYCCRTPELPTATALVKFVDADGTIVPVDAKKLLTVKELDRVVVHGTAARDDDGNLTVLADGLFIEK